MGMVSRPWLSGKLTLNDAIHHGFDVFSLCKLFLPLLKFLLQDGKLNLQRVFVILEVMRVKVWSWRLTLYLRVLLPHILLCPHDKQRNSIMILYSLFLVGSLILVLPQSRFLSADGFWAPWVLESAGGFASTFYVRYSHLLQSNLFLVSLPLSLR